MKKLLYTALSALFVLTMQSCVEDKLVDQVIDETVSGGALRNISQTNSLDLRDMSSTYEIMLETQDAQNGNSTTEVRVLVGFIDDDETNDVDQTLFTTIPASSFGTTDITTHGLPVATFRATLQDLVSHVNLSAGEYDEGDQFDIDFEQVLNDGRVFNAGNATGDVTRTGRFSYFNAQFAYTPAIADPTLLVLDDVSVKSASVRSGVADTVFLSFDQAFTTAPTVTRTSALGRTDDAIGAVTQIDGGDYFFLYTPGAAAVDTISFTIAGGEAVSGVTMTSVTEADAYIVDNVIPVGTASTSGEFSGNSVTSVTVTVTYPEAITGDVTFDIASASFDDVSVTANGGDDGNIFNLTFNPLNGNNAIARGNVTMTVTASSGGTDAAGNSVSDTPLSITVQL